jgi:hypothetical protein
MAHGLDGPAPAADSGPAGERSAAREAKPPPDARSSSLRDPARRRIVDELDKAGERILANEELAVRKYDTLIQDRTARARAATAKALRTQRRLIERLSRRITVIHAAGDAAHAKTLTLRALELWAQGLAASERSVTAKTTARRRAADRETQLRLTQTGPAIAKARAALGLPPGVG